MTPYDCPICGTKLKVNSPQVIGVHERGKVHQAALKKQPVETVQKTVKAPIPPPPEYVPPVIPIQTTKIQTTKPEEPKNVKDTKTQTH